MSNHHEELADQVVAAFRDLLEPVEQERIGEARFRDLHQLVCEALSEELQTVTDHVQEMLQQLRKEVQRPELEL